MAEGRPQGLLGLVGAFDDVPEFGKALDAAVKARGTDRLPFDLAAAERYGSLRAKLERTGRRLAGADLRIACVALVNDCTLVTGNLKSFARLEGLSVENWL